LLIRAYLGREGEEELLHREDKELVALVRRELKQITGLDKEPHFWQVNRWPKSMPQYAVGHMERLKILSRLLPQRYPGLFLCGAGYRGVGIPDCIAQGQEAADQALSFLSNASNPVHV
jgi:oxygen-dependent protoporphyrinogen oxidase